MNEMRTDSDSNLSDTEKKKKKTKKEAPSPSMNCDRLLRALTECHRRSGSDKSLCRHLNRALAECLVTALCGDEVEAVRSLCGSAGTSLKRFQCERAQMGLSACLSAHQQ